MVLQPRSEDDIYDSLRNRLTNKIADLTNFVTGSFNYVWTTAFSTGLRENELQAAAAELSGWIDYSGGPLTEDDLDDLDMDDVDPEDINPYMEDEDLDQLVRIVGISRDPGSYARAEVEFTTVQAATEIPGLVSNLDPDEDITDEVDDIAGTPATVVSTRPDSTGDTTRFKVIEDAETDSGDTTVTAQVIAENIGAEYNIPSGQLVHLPNPPTGVQSVINADDTDGGVNEETNDQLRDRAKDAVFETSGGGTSNGIVGYIQQNTGAADVIVEEFSNEQPPYVDVVVDGGGDVEVEEAIDFAKPVGIEHNLIRPTAYSVSVKIDLEGQDIDTGEIESEVTDFIDELGIGDDFYRDKLFQIIFNADEDIVNTARLDILITDETHGYSTSQDVYVLDKGDEMEQENNVGEVRGTLSGSSHTFVKDTDYEVVDDSGNGDLDAIDFSIGEDNPDGGTDIFVDYEIEEDITFDAREKANSGDMTTNVV